MRPLARLALALRRDETGGMAIETAIVAPVLILMSLGAFQVSELVARQNELQSSMAVAQSIALSSDPDTADKRLTVAQVVSATTGININNVTVSEAYRCGAQTVYEPNSSACATGSNMSSYVKIRLTDTYTPVWAEYGVGQPIALDLTRYVMYRQATKS